MSSTFPRVKSCLALLLFSTFPLLLSGQSWQSAVALPTAAGSSSSITDLVTDGAGGYVVTGDFTGTITLGNTTLSSAGGQDIFVARFDASNQCTQAVSTGGTDYEYVAALAIDANGTVVVTGEFASPSITFGATTLNNASAAGRTSQDIFVARLSLSGQWSQAVRAGGAYDDNVADIALDANGTATVVGSFTGGTIAFGSRPLTSPSTSGALFVARLNNAGTWTQAVGAQSSGAPFYASGVALDASGNAIVCGYYFGNSLTLGNFQLTSFATTTAFVARLSNTGQWTQASQATINRGFAFADAIAVDGSGNAVVIGSFRESNVSFGTYPLTYNGPTNGSGTAADNLFVARLSSAGIWTQAAQATGSDNSLASALVLDSGGNAFVAGRFKSPSIGFGNTALTNTNTSSQTPTFDVFLARLNNAGIWNYAIAGGSQGSEYAAALRLTSAGAQVAGTFGPSPAAFGSITLTTQASYAGFIASLGGGALSNKVATSASAVLAPNPARTQATLRLPAASEAAAATLLDAQGRPVRTYPIAAHATNVLLDLTGLAPGLYVVRCGAAAGRLVVE